MTGIKSVREPLFHVVKKNGGVWWKPVIIRGTAIVLGLLVGLVFAWIYTGVDPFKLLGFMIDGVLGTASKSKAATEKIWNTLQDLSILLLVSIAVVPAFKMKFWNIGADGQVLMGCLASASLIYYAGDKLDNAVLLILMFLFSIAVGMIWAVIPAIFKAKWNTNETLFTLMMNYIATQIVTFVLVTWFPSGQNEFAKFYSKYGNLPKLGNNYMILIISATVLTVFMFFYLKNAKHGFELSLVGESVNTSKYVGIKVNRVIIRTLLLSGAICGFTGFLLVAGKDHSITTTMVAGRGFTAIIVVWLAKFNPIFMVLTSFMVVFLNRGTAQVLSKTQITNSALPNIVTAIVFFFIIGCEFFINYAIKFKKRKKRADRDFMSCDTNKVSLKDSDTDKEEK